MSASTRLTIPAGLASTLLNNGFEGLQGVGQDNLDVGLAILDEPLVLETYASLADVGFLDSVVAQKERTRPSPQPAMASATRSQ